MSKPAKAFWLFFGSVWLAIGSLFFAVGGGVLWHDSEQETRFAREGVAAAGVVLSKRMTGSDANPTFAVEYRFQAASNAIEGDAKVDGALWDRLVEGEALEVSYVRSAPEVHRIAGQANSRRVLGSVLAAVGGLLGLSGALVLWRAAARRR